MSTKLNINGIMAKHNIKTVKEFSNRIGIKYTTVRNWACGRSMPCKNTIDAICETLNCTPAELF